METTPRIATVTEIEFDRPFRWSQFTHGAKRNAKSTLNAKGIKTSFPA
jgi:hypothetical protein